MINFLVNFLKLVFLVLSFQLIPEWEILALMFFHNHVNYLIDRIDLINLLDLVRLISFNNTVQVMKILQFQSLYRIFHFLVKVPLHYFWHFLFPSVYARISWFCLAGKFSNSLFFNWIFFVHHVPYPLVLCCD